MSGFQAELDLAETRDERDAAQQEAADALAALAALQSGVRAVAETLVRTARMPEAEVQGLLAQLGVPLLERRHYRMRVKVAGEAIIDVVAADEREAQILAGAAVDRGARTMLSTMLPGGARVQQLYRDGMPEEVKHEG